MASQPIRWLHLSDLHMGCRGKEVWWQVRSELEESIRKEFQPIDLILVTGDLTYEAKQEQFGQLDEFLNGLIRWLERSGQKGDPLIIPVPGNHDVVHLSVLERAPFDKLEKFWGDPDDPFIESLRRELWENRKAAWFNPLFANYTKWLRERIVPRLEKRPDVVVRLSHFPGDLSVRLDLPDRPKLAVVGLNSAWVQYTEGNFKEKIELFTQQLHWALGDGDSASPLDVLNDRRNLLLMHHPPAWFSEKARQRFDEEIYVPNRFLICLHGHMHEGRSEAIVRPGGSPRYFFQARSLFGLEHYGASNETRTMGYAWGSMEEDGSVRIWPFKRNSRGGRQVFLWDAEFPYDRNGHCLRRPLADDSSTHGDSRQPTPPGPEDPPEKPRPLPPDEHLLPPEKLFGRKNDLKKLCNHFLRHNGTSGGIYPFVVLGGPGMGKTTLCSKALANPKLTAAYRNRRFYVSLEATASAEGLARAVAATLNKAPDFRISLEKDPVREIVNELARSCTEPTLLVLDAVEMPWDRDPTRLNELLDRLKGIHCLHLIVAIRGAKIPLALDQHSRRITVGPLEEEDSRQMLLSLADRPEPVDEAEKNDLESLVRDLDGIPLAIRLLAHRARVLPFSTLYKEWRRKSIRLLTAPSMPEGLAASIRLSVESPRIFQPDNAASRLIALLARLLFQADKPENQANKPDNAASRLLALLARLPDGIRAEDLEKGFDGDKVFSAIQALVDTGLVVLQNGRYQILLPIKEYVIDPTQYVRHPANLLPLDPGDWEKLVSHFVDLAKKGERLQWGEASALGAPKELKASLAEEANNITEILTLSLDDANTTYAVRAEEAADRVVRAALAFGRYQRFSGLGEAILLQHTIDVTEQLAHKFGRSKRGNTFLRLQAESHRVYASMLRMRSDLKRALTHYGKAKILYRRIGDGLGLAHCRRSLGDIARVRAKFERALRYYDKAVGLYDTELECIRHDNSDAKYRDICRGKANCIQRRGEIIRSREDKEEAKLYFEKALNIYAEIGDLIGQGFCEKGFADILSRDENTKDDARKKYERARKLFEEAGYLLGAADCHYSLGDLRLRWATTQENYAETLTEYQKAERLYEKIISKHGLANCHYSFGDVALALGQSPVAKDSYNRALGEYGSVGSKLGPANCFQGLSDVSEDPIAKKTFEQDATKNATKAFTDLVRTPKEQPQGFQFRAVDGTRKTYCRWRR